MINSNNVQIYYWYDDNGNGHKTRTIAAMNEFEGLAATEYICDTWLGVDNAEKLKTFLEELGTSRFIKNKKVILWIDTNNETLLYKLITTVTKQDVFLVLVSDTISKNTIFSFYS